MSKDKIKVHDVSMLEEPQYKSKRAPFSKFSELEQIVFQWLHAVRQAGRCVPTTMLNHNAALISRAIGIEEDSFKASN
jgi:hypothetical protein